MIGQFSDYPRFLFTSLGAFLLFVVMVDIDRSTTKTMAATLRQIIFSGGPL